MSELKLRPPKWQRREIAFRAAFVFCVVIPKRAPFSESRDLSSCEDFPEQSRYAAPAIAFIVAKATTYKRRRRGTNMQAPGKSRAEDGDARLRRKQNPARSDALVLTLACTHAGSGPRKTTPHASNARCEGHSSVVQQKPF